MLSLPRNDRKARWIILSFSVVICIVVTLLEGVTLNVNLGFNPHVFAAINAGINSVVSLLLLAGLITARRGAYTAHRRIMMTAIVLSVLFLATYVLHHLFAGSTWYGDTDRNGVVDAAEKAAAGTARMVYFVLLGTHILLAGVSLPFILFTAYRALSGDYARHRRLARITWPLWFYVAVSGPLVYFMISRYY